MGRINKKEVQQARYISLFFVTISFFTPFIIYFDILWGLILSFVMIQFSLLSYINFRYLCLRFRLIQLNKQEEK